MADSEDGARGGGEGRLWAVPSAAGCRGQSSFWGSGGEARRSWSINAFCAMVKTVFVNTKM